VIYTRVAALQAVAGLVLNPSTEIVITRNGLVIAELDDIEEIVVSSLRVTSPAGANGGTVSGDTIQVVGDFNQTSLNFNTITINGTQANDVVDISALASAHRIVFTSNGGQDTVIGALRPQDIVDMGPAASSSAARDGNGVVNRVAPAGDPMEVSRDLPAFGVSDGIEAMTGVRRDLRELAMAGPRNEAAGRTMIDMDDLLLDLVDSGPVASADIAMPIVIDTDSFFDHRSVLTDYAVS